MLQAQIMQAPHPITRSGRHQPIWPCRSWLGKDLTGDVHRIPMVWGQPCWSLSQMDSRRLFRVRGCTLRLCAHSMRLLQRELPYGVEG